MMMCGSTKNITICPRDIGNETYKIDNASKSVGGDQDCGMRITEECRGIPIM
jgi:hypothetical protein